MVVCELDNEVSGDIMGWKLPAWKALLFHRVVPAWGGLILYVTTICFDIALIYLHYQLDDRGLGAFAIIFLILPAVITITFSLASPPPGLRTEDSSFSINIEKSDVKWMCLLLLDMIVFPIAAIRRYCHQIFWWTEAVCASYTGDEDRTHKALVQARSPSPTELYLFLQAFVHSAPLAVVSLSELMMRFENPRYEKFEVQFISIVAATLRMASTATMYRRFEREKICGRKYPWAVNEEVELENKANEETEELNKTTENEEPIYETIGPRYETTTDNIIQFKHDSDLIQFSPRTSEYSGRSIKRRTKATSDLIQFSPRASEAVASESPIVFRRQHNNDMIQFSPRSSEGTKRYSNESGIDIFDTSSEENSVIMPLDRYEGTEAEPIDSDDEYIRPISIINKVAPIRKDNIIIENVEVLPPPEIEAPRPGSIAVWAERFIENAESIPMWLSAPTRRKYCDEVIKDEPDVPRHVPRNYMRGLEPQDATAALMNFLGWYMFFVSRLISIAAFIDFFPAAAVVVLMSHYQIMLLLLIIPQASTIRRAFYVFLAFIYLFCLMEIKIRFRHVRVWHVFWMIGCTLETIIFISLWSTLNNSFSDWWNSFVVRTSLISLVLSYACFLVYFILLKPKETMIYFDKPVKYKASEKKIVI